MGHLWISSCSQCVSQQESFLHRVNMFATAMISRGNQFLREVHLRAGSMEQAGFPRELEKWGSAASRVGFGRLGNGGSLWGLGLSCGLWECGCWFGSGEARAGKGEEWHEWEASTRKRQHVWESPTPRFSPEGELFESAEGVSPACACWLVFCCNALWFLVCQEDPYRLSVVWVGLGFSSYHFCMKLL